MGSFQFIFHCSSGVVVMLHCSLSRLDLTFSLVFVIGLTGWGVGIPSTSLVHAQTILCYFWIIYNNMVK